MTHEAPAPRAGIALSLLIALLALTAAGKHILYDSMDPDAFWHMRVADQLLRDGIGPIVDDISFASKQEPWTPYSWLAELFMRGIWDVGGYRLALLVHALCTMSILIFIALACRADRPRSQLAIVIACALAAFLCMPFLSFRPVTMCFVLIAMSRWLMTRRRGQWWIVPLCALGANVHFFIWITPAWLGCRFVGDFASKRRAARQGPTAPASSILTIARESGIALVVAAAIACCCTPMLPGVIQTMLHYQFGNVMVAAPIIAEFQPLWTGTMGLIATLMAAAMLMLAIAKWREVSLGEWLMIALATLLLLKMARFAPIFALTLSPIVARLLPALSDRTLARRPVVVGLGAVVLMMLVRVTAAFPPAPMSFDAWLNRNGPDIRGYPTGAAAFVETQIERTHGRVLNEFTWGGYLAWRLGPEYRVLMDERIQMYSNDFWLSTCLADDARRREFIRTIAADAAVLPVRRSMFHNVLADLGWRTIFSDEQAIVMVPPGAAVASSGLWVSGP
jgi:hypothetical protein